VAKAKPLPSNAVGFWRRLGAGLLDGLINGIPLALISYLVTGEAKGNWLTHAVSILYSLLLPVFWYGYTVGKRIVGVRIVKLNGEAAGFGTMLLRVVVGIWLVYSVTLGIGAIISAIMVVKKRSHPVSRQWDGFFLPGIASRIYPRMEAIAWVRSG